MLAKVWGLFKVLSFLGLIVTNVLTLTHAKVHDFFYSAIDKLPYAQYRQTSPTNKNKQLNQKLKKQASHIAKVKKTSSKISARLARGATVNLASLPAEAVPILGVATVVAVTAMDIHDACVTMQELDELNLALSGELASSEADKVCGMKVPTVDEILEAL